MSNGEVKKEKTKKRRGKMVSKARETRSKVIV